MALALCGVALLVGVACSRADGPAPVAWDRTRCAHCGMLVSDPAWAAQLQAPDGSVHHFDDPGCLLVALESGAFVDDPAAAKLYFQHLHQDRWIPGDAVAFTTAANSPMGYGIGAIVADEAADPISLEEAGHIAQQRDEARRNPASQVAPHPAAHGSAEQ
jgi:hypothetical protein